MVTQSHNDEYLLKMVVLRKSHLNDNLNTHFISETHNGKLSLKTNCGKYVSINYYKQVYISHHIHNSHPLFLLEQLVNNKVSFNGNHGYYNSVDHYGHVSTSYLNDHHSSFEKIFG
ncbi:hypothetical protein ACTFIV_010920 [Dictyostelium citrinum]